MKLFTGPSRPVLRCAAATILITPGDTYVQRLLIVARTSSDHVRICVGGTAAGGDKLDPATVISVHFRGPDWTSAARATTDRASLYLQLAPVINNRPSSSSSYRVLLLARSSINHKFTISIILYHSERK